MKTLKCNSRNIIFMYIMSLMVFTSCENFVAENPDGQLSPDNFYNTEEEAISGIMGVYDGLLDLMERQQIYTTDLHSDDFVFTKNAPPRVDLDRFRQIPTNPFVDQNWTLNYRQINRSNVAIEGISSLQSVSEDVKNDLLAEVRFLRAFFYFQLVRWFGDIPLITTTSFEEFNLERVSTEQIYEQIIEDLEFASEFMSVKSQRNVDPARVSKGAAQALLAKVYLTRASTDFAGSNDYQQAADLAEQVITSGEYGLFEEYRMAFDPEFENGKEHLFSAQSDVSTGEAASISSEFSPRVGGTTQGPFSSHRVFFNVSVSEDLFNSFEPGDVRKENHIWKDSVRIGENSYVPITTIGPLGTGIHTTKYTDSGEDATPGAQDNNYPWIRYAEVLLMHAEAENEVNGPTTAAYSSINQVRERAELDSLPDNLTQDQFRRAVWNERRHELYAEGHRFFDLVRTGRLKERVETAKPEITVQLPKHLLLPIPQNETDRNEAISENNPGY